MIIAKYSFNLLLHRWHNSPISLHLPEWLLKSNCAFWHGICRRCASCASGYHSCPSALKLLVVKLRNSPLVCCLVVTLQLKGASRRKPMLKGAMQRAPCPAGLLAGDGPLGEALLQGSSPLWAHSACGYARVRLRYERRAACQEAPPARAAKESLLGSAGAQAA